MEKALEFFDGWMKSQKEFLDNWVKTQREFLENWAEATKKMQESFLSMGGPQEGPARQMLDLYTSWVNNMVNTSKGYTDETIKIQETWKNTIEKQMEMNREMAKNFFELFKQAGEKK